MIKKFFSIVITFFVFFILYNCAQAREISMVPHWNKKVVTVYIPNQDKYSGSMKNAFSVWAGQSGGNLNFRFLEKGPANIDVVFNESASGGTPISSCSVSSAGNKITKAEIHIASKGDKINKYSNEYISKAMQHEVGRALGMPISRKPTSIMYLPINSKQGIQKFDVRKFYSINGWNYAERNMN